MVARRDMPIPYIPPHPFCKSHLVLKRKDKEMAEEEVENEEEQAEGEEGEDNHVLKMLNGEMEIVSHPDLRVAPLLSSPLSWAGSICMAQLSEPFLPPIFLSARETQRCSIYRFTPPWSQQPSLGHAEARSSEFQWELS